MSDVGIIDAHQHLWQLGRPECRWPTPALKPLYRDFTPEDFWAEASPCGVVGSVLVQSQPHPDDTRYLLTLAEHDPRILGVVGWVDLSAPAAAQAVHELADEPWLCGIRPMLQDLDEADWILRRARPEALEAMAERQLVFDALVTPIHLPVIDELARRHPSLRIVVDHGGKPAIGRGETGSWERGLAVLARRPNVLCKLSGLATEMAPEQPVEAMDAYIDRILDLFGAERVLWGSDWPVLTLTTRYSDWLERARERIRWRAPALEAALFRNNALEIYRLNRSIG
ncbi:amidohydrolase family protein [Marinimicrobium agarilyticum]|uniref:amidohydrolase family protein n=1 Tax=Marinimicrobium agarilyticum TaxID=306546 RepID=UPI0004078904|nr:amidohydrolase family protein [Marinimicrobium agarilyticum]